MTTVWTPPQDIAEFADGDSDQYNTETVGNLEYLYDRVGNIVRLPIDLGGSTTTTLGDTGPLGFPVLAGGHYTFRFGIIWTTATATTGITIGATFPTSTVFAATVRIPVTADGTGGELQGWITSSGDAVTGSGAEATGTPYLAVVEGVIVPSASGTLQIQHAAEVGSAGAVVVKQGSWGILAQLA